MLIIILYLERLAHNKSHYSMTTTLPQTLSPEMPSTPSQLIDAVLELLYIVITCLFWAVVLPVSGLFCIGVAICDHVKSGECQRDPVPESAVWLDQSARAPTQCETSDRIDRPGIRRQSRGSSVILPRRAHRRMRDNAGKQEDVFPVEKSSVQRQFFGEPFTFLLDPGAGLGQPDEWMSNGMERPGATSKSRRDSV